MDVSDRPPRSIWYRFRLKKYEIKERERPKSWAYGNYRQLAMLNDEGRGMQQVLSTAPRPQTRQSMPPAPPVRAITTQISSVTSLPTTEKQQEDDVEGNSSESSKDIKET
ncbi:hypothetical protein FOCC_FOCC009451, partial [Frankliniella occidentalis]